ncbi:MAG: ATP-binding cassette domain-containing protein [Pseudomonadales bacterium]|nr:ATP-binding cassette domain-containing protein [Pseudomonadales bacterium]
MTALVFTAGVSLSIGQGVRVLVDDGFATDSHAMLNQSVALFMGLIVLLAGGSFVRSYLVAWLGERVVADIRKQVYQRLVNLDPAFYEKQHTGELQSRITTDTTLLQTVIGSSLSMALRNFLLMIGGFILLFITNVKLTAIVICAVPIVVMPILIYGRRVRDLSRRSQDRVAQVGAYVGESLRHLKTVQAFNHQSVDVEQFNFRVEQAFSTANKRIKQRSSLVAIVILLVLGAVSVMFWVGGHDVLEGRISPGELAAFVFYAVIVGASVGAVSEVLGDLQRAAGAAERLLDLMRAQSNIIEPHVPANLPAEQPGRLSIEKVFFHYPSRPEQWALDDVSLKVAAGSLTALVGPSGAGKTTLFDILLRFYDVQHGQLFIDDIDIRQLGLASLRDQFAIVPQRAALFTGTVADNIAYGARNVTRDDIVSAAKLAFADEFIACLPQGYDSPIGEGGVGLSGGQQQRIAIARAILKNPRFLLLDEATSALDAESEHKVQMALGKLMEGRTTLVIAHRLATVVHADQIVVMDRGKIAAIGTHQELVTSNPLYERLAALQFSEPEGAIL